MGNEVLGRLSVFLYSGLVGDDSVMWIYPFWPFWHRGWLKRWLERWRGAWRFGVAGLYGGRVGEVGRF